MLKKIGKNYMKLLKRKVVIIIIIIQAIAWFLVPFFINTMNQNIKKIVKQLEIITGEDKYDK